MMVALSFLLRFWQPLLGATLAAFVTYKVIAPLAYQRGFNSGWSEGRTDLSNQTSLVLEEKRRHAEEADRELGACLADPSCLHKDDGWRLDRAD